MLNLNVDKEVSSDVENTDNSALATLNDTAQSTWKVLVFDSVGRDIISSVLRVNDLFKVCFFFSSKNNSLSNANIICVERNYCPYVSIACQVNTSRRLIN
jgi:hypothetical protein